MAPRKTRNGATTAAKRASAQGGARSSSSSRPGAAAVALAGAGVRRSSPRTPARPASGKSRVRGTSGTCKDGAPISNRWWLLPVSVVALLALFAWSYYPVARVQYRETRQQAKLEAELAALQARNARLSAQVARLRTPEGVEDYARSQLGMVKSGEHVAIVIDGNEAKEASAALAAPSIDGDSFVEPVGPWTGFLDIVFGVQ